MNQQSKDARQKLKKATRAEFESLVYEALLTPFQRNVIRLYICEGLTVLQIAMRLQYSEAGIRRSLSQIYEKVSKI